MSGNVKDFAMKNRGILLAMLVLLIYLSPNIFFPHKARFLIHDNLDSNVLWYKNLAESGKMFAGNDAVIPASMGGLPRGCYPAEYNLQHLLYLWFSPLFAYNLNIILTHVLAFLCMYVFCRKYIFKPDEQWVLTGVALLFALLPFWPAGGLTLATQPLLLYALLNILRRDASWKDWAVVGVIPFLTVLIHSNFFLLVLLSVYALYYFIAHKKINYHFIVAVFLYGIISVLLENRLFRMQFVEHFESHRAVLGLSQGLNLKGIIGISILHFLKGQYHYLSLQFPFILLVAAMAFLFRAERKEKYKLAGILAGLYIISLLFVLPDWQALRGLMSKYKLLSVLSLRFYSLFPLLWFIVLALASAMIVHSGVWGKRFVAGVLVLFGLVSFTGFIEKDYYKSSFAENSFYRTYINRTPGSHASFDEYYKTALFAQVQKHIPPGEFYTASININPEVAQFNGYRTIDGYFFYYPEKYALLMDSVNRLENLKSNSPGVDSRCYISSDDVNKGRDTITDLRLDFGIMKRLNTQYIFSDRKIIADRLGDEAFFSSGNDRLFVYRIR